MAVLVLCAAGVAAVSLQIRCVDAAREAARLAARGDTAAAAVARKVAPAGAVVELRHESGYVTARVSVPAPALPWVVITGAAVAADEPAR